MSHIEIERFSKAVAANPNLISDIMSEGFVPDKIADRIKTKGFNVSREDIALRLRDSQRGSSIQLPAHQETRRREIEAGAQYTWTFTYTTAQIQAYAQIYIIAEVVVGIVATVA